MKPILILMLAMLLLSCTGERKKQDAKTEITVEQPKAYGHPFALHEVFEEHGGIDKWKTKKTLTFHLPKSKAAEIHTVDLPSRKDKVQTDTYTMGYDGNGIWLMDANKVYKGDPMFYHNLMFYFYAMPFVLDDHGISYHKTEDLVYEGKRYPGFRISYDEGIGTSSKDEYFIHYDRDTKQMVWLGYTVTYGRNENSSDVRWIHYDNWEEVDGLLMPKSITWHAYEGRAIKEPKNTYTFENAELSKTALPHSFYAKPEAGYYVSLPE